MVVLHTYKSNILKHKYFMMCFVRWLGPHCFCLYRRQTLWNATKVQYCCLDLTRWHFFASNQQNESFLEPRNKYKISRTLAHRPDGSMFIEESAKSGLLQVKMFKTHNNPLEIAVFEIQDVIIACIALVDSRLEICICLCHMQCESGS